MQMHHGPQNGPPPPGLAPQQQPPPRPPVPQSMQQMNEAVWLQIGKKLHLNHVFEVLTRMSIGSFAELLGNLDEAMSSYEHALRANPRSIPAMNAISCILRTQEQFHKAVEFLQQILQLDGNNGDVWGSLGI